MNWKSLSYDELLVKKLSITFKQSLNDDVYDEI